MTGQYMETAREIVALGVDDPDLFVAMALFEEGVGPDRISDMTANVIFGDLLRFNTRVLAEIGVPGTPMQLRLRNGRTFDAVLPVNPYLKDGGPVVLVSGHSQTDHCDILLEFQYLVGCAPTHPKHARYQAEPPP